MAPFSGKKVPKVDRLPRPWLDEAEKRNPESPLIDFRDSSDFGRKNLMVEAGTTNYERQAIEINDFMSRLLGTWCRRRCHMSSR